MGVSAAETQLCGSIVFTETAFFEKHERSLKSEKSNNTICKEEHLKVQLSSDKGNL